MAMEDASTRRVSRRDATDDDFFADKNVRSIVLDVQLCAEVQKGWPVAPLLRAMTPTLSRQALCAAPGELGEQIAVGRYLILRHSMTPRRQRFSS